MAVVAAQVAVSTTAVKLSADDGFDGSSILVQAPSASILFVGGRGVTSASGYPIPAAAELSINLRSFEELWGVLASGSGTAAVLRAGV